MILVLRNGAELPLPDADEHLAQQFGAALQAARALQDPTTDHFIDVTLALLKDASDRQTQEEQAEPAEHPMLVELKKIAAYVAADRQMIGDGPNARSRVILPKGTP